jgi:hypothetical protein
MVFHSTYFSTELVEHLLRGELIEKKRISDIISFYYLRFNKSGEVDLTPPFQNN